jgi:UDP-3-O-[3-hydroxymyristoyl] glucosamine N-acyltransferase
VRQLAQWIDGVVEGDDSIRLDGIAPIDSAGEGQLTFATDDKRLEQLTECGASAALVAADAAVSAPMTLIRVERIDRAIAEVLARLAPPADLPETGIHASATIDPSANVADDAAVAPNVVIGPGATVGPRCRLAANVVVGRDVTLGADCVLFEGVVVEARSQLGDRVRVGPNSVIGYEGFGYFQADGVHHRIEHMGNVVIEDDVDLGACVCVDRAKFGSTRIGRGAKIDNLVQIAHNVQIGQGSILVGQCGVAGSAQLGRYVMLGGGAGVRDNISIGDGAQVAAHSAVANDVDAGQSVGGTPARPMAEMRRVFPAMVKLPDLLKRVKALEKKMDELG